MKAWFRESALSIVLALLFFASVAGQVGFGYFAYNAELAERGAFAIGLPTYLTSGHFLEALFENWESEFLQMGVFLWLSAKLVQKGSAESRPLDGLAESDEDPRRHRARRAAPWPVRKGGWILWLYERSLLLAFGGLFLLSFALHAIGGRRLANEERAAQGLSSESLSEFIGSSEFWFQSMQNWQSEFLSILAMVVFTIFLRQRGSPQSKPVAAPHAETPG